jgi:hypothetical protein
LRPSGRGRFQTKNLIPTLESPNGNSPSTPLYQYYFVNIPEYQEMVKFLKNYKNGLQ